MTSKLDPAALPGFDPGPLSVWGRQEKTEIGGFYVIGPDRMGSSTAYVSGEANARLYAAAPELYAACKAIVDFAECSSSPHYETTKELIKQANAALAKGNGGP